MLTKATDMEVWEDELPPPYYDIKNKVKDIDGLFCLLTDNIDAGVIEAGARLKIISNMAVGFNNIDVAAATKKGVLVGYTPGVLTETTADFAFSLLLAAGRRVVEGDRATRSGKWKTWGPMFLLGYDPHHATLGLVGCGRIGLEVARRAKGFSMKVLYYDTVRRKPEEEREFGLEFVPDLYKLLGEADFISVHVPLIPETRHLFSTRQFNSMKPTAVFVNTSRGPVVDQKALYEALKAKRIFAAALDVTEVEPIPANDPLLTLDNCIIAPHIASATVVTRAKMAVMAAENLLAGLKDELPPNCVNPEVLKKGK
jgi:glyoxylate reductase